MSNQNGIMKGRYTVKRPLSSTRDFKLVVSKPLGSSVGISLGIKPHNRMYGRVDIAPRPRITNSLTLKKDTYVYEAVDTLNYGDRSVIRVGTDKNGERLRSYATFDLKPLYDATEDALTDNLIIVSAKLKLHVANPHSIEMFELSTINRDYNEYGTTWANQPSRDQFIDIVEVQPNIKEMEIDVTDTVEDWYNKERTNFGFLLKEFENTSGKEIVFYSKEGSKSPELIVEYFDPNFGLPRRHTRDISLRVLQHRENTLNINMNVFTYKREESLPIELITVSKIGELYTQLTVSKINFPLQMRVKKLFGDDNTIPIEFSVSNFRMIEKDIELNVSKRFMPLEFNTRAIHYLPLDVRVRRFYDYYKNIELHVSTRFIPLELNTRAISYLPLNVRVQQTTDNIKDIEFHISTRFIPLQMNVRKFSEIGIQANISTQDLYLDMGISKRFTWLEMNVLKKLADETIEILGSCSQINLPIQVKVAQGSHMPLQMVVVTEPDKVDQYLPIQVGYSKPTVPISVLVRKVSLIPIELTVKGVFEDYKDIEMNVVKYLESEKSIELNVRAIDVIPILMDIRSRFLDLRMDIKKNKQTFKNIELNVKGISDLELEALVRKTKSILLSAYIKKIWFDDLTIRLNIDGETTRKSYVFIL